jgi:hypothetical protein
VALRFWRVVWCVGLHQTVFEHRPHTFVARHSVLSVLENAISVGHLTITESDESWNFGQWTEGSNDVHLNILNEDFWPRVLLSVSFPFIFSFSLIPAFRSGNLGCQYN